MEWKNLSDKIIKNFNKDKKIKLIMLSGFLGIILIFLSENNKSGSIKQHCDEYYTTVNMETRIIKTEEKLSNLISHIEGVGNCKIMVTYENDIEYVYANESKIFSDINDLEEEKIQRKISKEDHIVIIDSEHGKEALKIKEIQPKVRGVVVVCDGANNIKVCQEIINTVTVALNISSTKIYVAQSNTNN